MASQEDSSRRWGPVPWGRLPFAPSTAHLAHRGLSVVLFEADRIGSGASGRTGGLALEGLTHGPREGASDCLAGLAKLVDELSIDCGLALPGCWEIEHRVRTVAESPPWTDGGASIGIRRTVPGGVVEPSRLVTGIAAAAIAAGAKIYEQSRVEQLDPRSNKVQVKLEAIHPGSVIVALNAWTSALVPAIRNVQAALTYACVTEPLSEDTLEAIGLVERIPFYTIDTPYLWGRVCDDRSVVFGAGLTAGDAPGLETIVMTDHEPAAILDRLVGRVHRLHPLLADVAIRARWAGPVAFREGAIPILTRYPANENLLIAGAYAGHGVAFSVHAGRLMADAIINGTAFPEWGAI